MDRSRSSRSSSRSSFSALLGAALLLVPGAAGALGQWSVPEVRVSEPEPGVTERVETMRRHIKDDANRHVLETLIRAGLDNIGSRGRYSILKKRVYEKRRLVTFYRKMEVSVSADGGGAFALNERTQISKNERGDYRSTLIREYFFGPSAVRLMIGCEPALLSKTYSLKVFLLQPNGTWPRAAAVRGHDIAGVFLEAREALGKGRKDAGPLADLVLSLWSDSLARNEALDLAQFLSPLLNPGGDAFLKGVDDVEPIIDRAIDSLDENDAREYWRGLSGRLAEARSTLADGPRGIERYSQAAAPLLQRPQRAMDSQLQWLQDMSGWLTDAHRKLSALPRGSPEYEKLLASLPEGYAGRRARRRSDIYLRALSVMHINREIRAIDAHLAGRKPAPDEASQSLIQLRDRLQDGAGRWGSELSRLEPPRENAGFLTMLLGAFASPAWAAGGGGSSFFDVLYSFPVDPIAVTPDFAIPMAGGSLHSLPEFPAEALNAGFLNQLAPATAWSPARQSYGAEAAALSSAAGRRALGTTPTVVPIGGGGGGGGGLCVSALRCRPVVQ